MKDCKLKRRFKCNIKINDNERKRIFDYFYDELNKNRQYDFIAQTTTTSTISESSSTRRRSFKNHFISENESIQVCKAFYLGILDISQKVVYNVLNKKNSFTGVSKTDARGKHKRIILWEESRNGVRRHIESFPMVESHYCRANTSNNYLHSNLNICKLYDLYVKKSTDDQVDPLKEWLYRNISKTEYKLGPTNYRKTPQETHKTPQGTSRKTRARLLQGSQPKIVA